MWKDPVSTLFWFSQSVYMCCKVGARPSSDSALSWCRRMLPCCHRQPRVSGGVWKTAWYIHCHKQVCFLFKPFPSWGQLNVACLLGSQQFKGSSYARIVQSNLKPRSISGCLWISVTVWSSSPQRSEEVFKSEDAQTLVLYVQNHPHCLRIL